jgi:Fungalysin/Thermolysin Propeptide Motif
MTVFGRPGVVSLAAVLLVCCRAPSMKSVAATSEKSHPPQAASAEHIRDLKRAFPTAEIQLDPTGVRVTRIQGLTPPGRPESAEEIARAVLRIPTLGTALGLSRDLRELCAPVSRQDPQAAGYAVVRIQQCVDGVPVLGAEVVMNVQMAPSPMVDTLTSSLVPDAPARATPRVSRESAIRAAAAAVSGQSVSSTGGLPAELIVFAPSRFQLDGPTRLSWRVRVARTTVLVDAATGSILHQYSDVIR